MKRWHWLRKTLQLKKSKLGEAHPSTLETMYELADHLLGAGQQEQALPLLEKTVELRKITLGPDHPDTISAMDVLSNLHADRHEYAAATALLLNVSEHRPLAAGIWYRLGLMHVASGEKEAYQPAATNCSVVTWKVLSHHSPVGNWHGAASWPRSAKKTLQVERLARESYAAAPDDQRARHELALPCTVQGNSPSRWSTCRRCGTTTCPVASGPGSGWPWSTHEWGMRRNRRGTSTCPLKPARRRPGRLVRTPRWSTSFCDAKRKRSWRPRRRSQTSHRPVTETNRFTREDDTTHNPSLRRRRSIPKPRVSRASRCTLGHNRNEWTTWVFTPQALHSTAQGRRASRRTLGHG